MKDVVFDRNMRTIVVAEAASVRQMLSDAVRSLGIVDVTVLGSGQDVLSYLEVDAGDWLITPLLANGEVNALQILSIIAATPRLRELRVSLLYDDHEENSLPKAFELGILSSHRKSYLRDDVVRELRELLCIARLNANKPVLIAAEYLRRLLYKQKSFGEILSLEQNLLDLQPGSASLLLRLGEAQIMNDQAGAGLKTLHQAIMLDENAKEAADRLAVRLVGKKVTRDKGTDTQNVLGVKTCVIVDPDSAVQNGLRELLSGAGVPQIETFDDGAAAWDWIAAHPEPDLILQEWRIPGVSGPMLLQRIRQQGFHRALVTVVSSIIKPKEVHLLREMGVDDVVAKPFTRQGFFKSIIWTIQQNVSPTQRGSLERKIYRLLKARQIDEAERLKEVLLGDARIPVAAKRLVQAEFAFHFEKFREARDLAIESLRLAGDTLPLLNLVGKALIKLGDHGAALKFFEKAHALSPLNLEHVCNLAVSQCDTGDLKAAGETMQRAKALDGRNELVGNTDCQIAILAGQTARAKELMAQLASVMKIIGYMNNRAVALSRCGRYEDGIKLYQQTAASLPGDSGDTHDIVSYNLALAYARYGELKLCADQLQSLAKRPSAPLARKAESLLKRVRHAEAKGTALTFFEAGRDEADDAPHTEATDASVARQTGAALPVSRGDLCLSGVFLRQSSDAASERLLAKMPRFTEREAIARPEAMTRLNTER